MQITEVRGVAADDIRGSPAKKFDVYGIHFTWYKNKSQVYHKAMVVQDILTKYDYRVHWGKFFIYRPEIWKTLDDDQTVLRTGAPTRYMNCWTAQVLYDEVMCRWWNENEHNWLLDMENEKHFEEHDEL